MLNTIVRKPTKTILYGAALTAVALVITLLAVSFATGSAQAQTPPPGSSGNTDGSGDPSYPNLSTYPDPQPCGPGAGTAFMDEPHEIQTGHYALFDAYWRTISKGEQPHEVAGVGVLHTNLCPPEMVKTTKRLGGRTVVKINRSERNGGMDVDEIIMHVLNTHLATTSETSISTGYLSLAEYPAVKKHAPAGSPVWWLRLDDPRTTGADEASDLGIGFSTELLKDQQRWGSMRYKFEVERHPNDPTDVPHFFAYESPDVRSEGDEGGVKLVWDSSKAGEGEVLLSPGEYKGLQWVFTKPGTYLLWVHLLADVKKPDPNNLNPGWKPISDNETETSEVYRYTIQVGDILDETEPPIFGVNRSVPENSFGGTKVGDPIPVYNAEAPVLYYALTGDGHSKFETVVASTDPHAVQIVVADDLASLDFEATSTYELNLTVTDRVDHEDNFDPKVDDVLIAKIDLEDRGPGLLVKVDNIFPAVGETVNFVAKYEPTKEHIARGYSYEWVEMEQTLHDGIKWHVISSAPNAPTWSVSQSSAVTKTYRVSVVLDGDPPPIRVHSEDVTIYWGGP